jgi:Zn-dependent peptidase ImmA (M78 family)
MARAHIPFVEPKPLGVGREVIERMAYTFIKEAEFNPGGFIDCLVARFGGRSTFASELPHEIDLEVWGQEDFHIYKSTMTSLKRERYSTALALSHYLLHFDKIQSDLPGHGMQVYRAGFKEPSSEVHLAIMEAHWFASEMLMPTQEFLERIEVDTPDQLAVRFDVSLRHAEMRAEGLRKRMKTQSVSSDMQPGR